MGHDDAAARRMGQPTHDEWVKRLGREPTQQETENRDQTIAQLDAIRAIVAERGPMTWEGIAEAGIAPTLTDVIKSVKQGLSN